MLKCLTALTTRLETNYGCQTTNLLNLRGWKCAPWSPHCSSVHWVKPEREALVAKASTCSAKEIKKGPGGSHVQHALQQGLRQNWFLRRVHILFEKAWSAKKQTKRFLTFAIAPEEGIIFWWRRLSQENVILDLGKGRHSTPFFFALLQSRQVKFCRSENASSRNVQKLLKKKPKKKTWKIP